MNVKHRPEDYRRVISWVSGETVERNVNIGGFGREASGGMPNLGLLRVGYWGSLLGPAVDVWVDLSDGGTSIGDATNPLDAPLVLVAEEPFTVHLRPVAAAPSTGLQMIVSVTPVCCTDQRLLATRSIAADLNDVIALPQWCRAVGAVPNAQFTWRDRASGALSVALTGVHERPAPAAEVLVNVAGTIMLYY